MKGLSYSIGVLLLMILCVSSTVGQETKSVTTFDFVQIQNDNNAEAIYYYENNWLQLRKRAVEEDYIHSYEWFEVERQEDAPFDLILMTTYRDQAQFAVREENFKLLIDEKGARKLLNEKQPTEFRRILFSKEESKHLGK